MQARPLEDWTTNEVCSWLEDSLKLPQYSNTFQELSIDGMVIAQLNEEDLKVDFSINIRIHRVKIMEGIKKLLQRAQEPPLPATAPSPASTTPVAAEAAPQFVQQSPSRFQPNAEGSSSLTTEDQQRLQAPAVPRTPPSQQNNPMSLGFPANSLDGQGKHKPGEFQDSKQPAEPGMNIHEFDPLGSSQFLVLKAIEGILLNNTFVVGVDGATLGRHSASNKIVISESYVSRKHCQIRYFDSHFYVRDVRSTTGTFVMLRDRVKLEYGLMFQMGLSEFRVTKLLPNKTVCQLQIFEGPAREKKITVDTAGLTIGRDQSNALSVTDDSQMSNHHAKIINIGGDLYLQDEGSTNKQARVQDRTWLRLSAEGDQSEWRMLRVEDIIKIGSTVFTVEKADDSLLQQARNAEDEETKNVVVSESRGCPTIESKDRELCEICLVNEVNVLWDKCRHLFGCLRCARECKNQCPVCRMKGTYTQIFRP